MNPSTEDLLNACNKVNAEKVIILPNNSNIIMAAEQVKNLCEREVRVLPSKSVMQAITALIAYNPEGEVEETLNAMIEEMKHVAYAEMTTAVRDSEVNGLDIKEGDTIGLLNGKIDVRGTSVEEVISLLLGKMVNEDSELITLLYGDDIDENTAESLGESLREKYPDCEIELHIGGQPHYSYLISVE
jgi:dihydroxyacetone kinase-like predicted kinase